MKKIINIIMGNSFSQLILIAGTSILVRLYSPDDMGLVGLITSVLLIFGIIGCARFDQLIFQCNDNESKNASISYGVSYLLIISSLLLLILIIMSLLKLLPIVFLSLYPLVISFSLIQLFNSALSLEKKYSVTIKANILRSCLLIFFQVILYKLGSYGLVFGIIISQTITAVYLYNRFYNDNHHWLKIKIKFGLYRVKDIIYSSSHSLFSSLSSQLPAFTIPILYNFELLGYYMLGMKLTQLPITFFTNAIRPYILSELSSISNDGKKTFSLVLYGSSILILISLIGILAINKLGVLFFKIYAGDEWVEAGIIAGVLSFWLLTSFANVIAISYLTILGKFKLLFYYDFFVLIARGLVVVSATILDLNFHTFIVLFSSIGGITNLVIIVYSILIAYFKNIYKS